MKPGYIRTGRPPGIPTTYWTDDELKVLRDTIKFAMDRLPGRTPSTVVRRLMRLHQEEYLV
jgi:hypothetical protein